MSTRLRCAVVGGAVALGLATPLAAVAGVETLARERKSVEVRFVDGTERTYELRYTNFFSPEHHRSGKHYSHAHPIDTRQCRWTAKAFVKREVCLESASGEPFCDVRWNRIYDRPVLKSQPNVTVGFSPPNCEFSKPRFEPQFSAVRADAVQAFPDIIQMDRSQFLQDDLSVDVAVAEVRDTTRLASRASGPLASSSRQPLRGSLEPKQ